MTQWWERSPPTILARIQIPASIPYVGWVCCLFSPLLRKVFLRVLRFSPLLKKTNIRKFQFDQELGRQRTTVDVLPPNNYLLFIYLCYLPVQLQSVWGAVADTLHMVWLQSWHLTILPCRPARSVIRVLAGATELNVVLKITASDWSKQGKRMN